ncbi:MAG: hypothetical protein OSB25_01020 [Salibacteraceae bacterium]|nr:hypothetical protein [Salibacteraceae bacterium]
MHKLTLGILVICSGLISCKKEGCTDFDASNYDSKANTDNGNRIVEGCTDTNAVNFLSKATNENGTCHYEAGVVLWYNAKTSKSMQSIGIDELTYVVNGIDFGKFPTTTFWPNNPGCSLSNTISASLELGSEKSGIGKIDYYFKGNFQGTQDISLNANECTSLDIGR